MARKKTEPSERYLIIRNQEVWDEYHTLELAQQEAEELEDLDAQWDELMIAKVVSVGRITGVKWE